MPASEITNFGSFFAVPSPENWLPHRVTENANRERIAVPAAAEREQYVGEFTSVPLCVLCGQSFLI